MKKPVVSIIMSTFNNGKFVHEAIERVLLQTYKEWEFIIINDASKDDTKKTIESYIKRDKRIRFYSNKTNKGLVTNLTVGINRSKGIYIARIDGDDKWIDKNKLKKQVAFL